MCGIAGFAAQGRDDAEVADRLRDRLAHRGPDGGWCVEAAGLWLVQTRLAVIDLSPAVRYPMDDEHGRLGLLFNGEIYNHPELRAELEARGHRFATRCDAEVVVHGYEEWGEDVFPRLNGMWAVALADRVSGELVLARDRFGIKPLAYTTSGRFAFASEVTALVAAGLSAGRPDTQAVLEFLAFHYVPSPATGVQDVEQLPPGHVLRRSADGAVAVRRWSHATFGAAGGPPPDAAEADAALSGAVARQCRADVPVGVLLSGGVDSALVLGMAVEAGFSPTAFTLGFPGHGDYDETAAAQRTAARYGVPHVVHELDLDFGTCLREHARAYDMPFADPSAIATVSIAERAARDVVVALSGTGGDDLFAGYYRHRAVGLHRAGRVVPAAVRRRLAALRADRGAERASAATQAMSYLARWAQVFDSDRRDAYLGLVGQGTPSAASAVGTGEGALTAAHRVADRHRLPAAAELDLDGLQEFELATYLAGDLLVKEDRATMAHGLEGRVPLLDDDVVAIAARTTPRQRATLLSGKRLLMAVARGRGLAGRLPARKRGFAVPLGPLLRGPWAAPVADHLSAGGELVDGDRAVALLRDPATPPLDVWALTSLLAWERRLAAARAGA